MPGGQVNPNSGCSLKGLGRSPSEYAKPKEVILLIPVASLQAGLHFSPLASCEKRPPRSDRACHSPIVKRSLTTCIRVLKSFTECKRKILATPNLSRIASRLATDQQPIEKGVAICQQNFITELARRPNVWEPANTPSVDSGELVSSKAPRLKRG